MEQKAESSQNPMEIDWLSYLKDKYPNIAKVYLKPSDVVEVNKKMITRNNNLLLRSNSNLLDKVVIYDTTFYDLFMRVIHNDMGVERERKFAKQLLGYLDKLIGDFFFIVKNDANLIQQLAKQLKGFFLINEDKYRDKIGELLSTIFLIKKFDSYQLESLEFKYENSSRGKDVDILFKNKSSEELILVEILNINPIEDKIGTEEEFLLFLNTRVAQKIAAKKFEIARERFKDIRIQPFLWIFNYELILKHKSAFESLEAVDVLPALCLRQRSTENGEIVLDCIEAKNLST